jgi:membrane-associated protease RseP (regulator of RpoE activity)
MTMGLAAAPLSAQVFAPLALVADEEGADDPTTDYWIGVRCAEVPPLLRAQLDLPEGQGVLVDEVVPQSPAQQAGLKAFDVIFRVNDKPVLDPQALAGAVARAGDSEVRIEYLRAGRKQTVTVKPAQRPESLSPHREDQQALREWVERLGQGPAPMRFRFFHPGMVVPPGASLAPALPDDVTVMIEKHGDKPAKVIVKRGDKEWQATEDALDKLPGEARGFAAQMLGINAFAPGNIGAWEAAPHAPGIPPRARPFVERHDADAQVKQRLDELTRQVDELRKAFENQEKQRAARERQEQ